MPAERNNTIARSPQMQMQMKILKLIYTEFDLHLQTVDWPECVGRKCAIDHFISWMKWASVGKHKWCAVLNVSDAMQCLIEHRAVSIRSAVIEWNNYHANESKKEMKWNTINDMFSNPTLPLQTHCFRLVCGVVALSCIMYIFPCWLLHIHLDCLQKWQWILLPF